MALNGFSGAISGTTGIDNWNVAITSNAPEPGTFVALSASLFGLVGLRRKRKLSC